MLLFRRRKFLLRCTAGYALLLAIVTVVGCNPARSNQPKAKVEEVLYVTPTNDSVTEFEEFTGRTAAVNMVDVRARVSGYLKKVNFTDGADVKAGEVLFEIDPAPFEAEVARTKANVNQYTQRLQRLDLQIKRAEPLLAKEALSQEEYEIILFDRNEADALHKAAIAAERIAQINLDFTKVVAPQDGRISRRLVDPGNLVMADQTPLANIVSVDPVHAYFDVDERTVLKLRRLVRAGSIEAPRESEVTVRVALADETEFNHTGIVNFVDNQVDALTGTLRYRVRIDNPYRLLSPGLFVRLRFPIGAPHDALLVPEEALATDQGRHYVYVVDAENKIRYQPVEVGMLKDGKRVIADGVSKDDRVVVTGLQRIRPRAEVVARERKETPQAAE